MIRRLATACFFLALNSFALAQQPAEWHPNLAEDNKAATWEDTSNFLVNSLASYSGGLINASATSRCQLAVASKTISEPLGMTMSVFDEHMLQIAFVKPGSFAEKIGLQPGMKLIGISVNGEAKLDSQGLRIRSVAGFEALEGTLKQGDRIQINVYSDNLAKSTIAPLRAGGKFGSAAGTLTLASGVGYTIDFARIDPLSVVVRGGSIFLSGSSNAGFATPTPKTETNVNSIAQPIGFPITDADMAKRVARALMHAALLCGGTKAVSPF